MKNINTALVVACAALAVFLVPTAIAPSLLQEAEARIGHPNNCTLPPCPWNDPDSGWSLKAKGGEGSFEFVGGFQTNTQFV